MRLSNASLERVVDLLGEQVGDGFDFSVGLDVEEFVPEVLLDLNELRFPCLALLAYDFFGVLGQWNQAVVSGLV